MISLRYPPQAAPCFEVKFQSHPNFFGLTFDYRASILQEIYTLVKHGGFSYSDILIMPIMERRYFIDLILREVEQKQEAMNSAANKKTRH